MKKYLFLVATLLLTMSLSVSAQNNNRGNANNRRSSDNRRSEQIKKVSPKERADLMASKLDLTAEQTAQVQALMEKQDAERLEQVTEQRKQRDTGSVNRDAKIEEFRKARLKEVEQYNAELEKIIGKEKVEKWNQLRKDVRDINQAGRRDPAKRNK